LINIMKNFKDSEIPTISLFLSGRPLIVNEELNASDAFVSLWLPGTAIEGISDVLLSNKDDSINYDFVGKLSYTWPKFNNAE
ncbi:MAG: glycoside hydrolase family 3 C-terminal domain-containing protein, partial [Gammaproteobacteria bacterium]